MSARQSMERRSGVDRRDGPARRRPTSSWGDQRSQYLTRYLFFAFAIAYYDYGNYRSPSQLVIVDWLLGAYCLVISAFLLHARHRPIAPWRWRTAMWIDILIVSFLITADPDPMPPFLIYTMIVLGNGMRYGMGLFREGVIASFACALVAFSVRYSHHFDASLPTAFLMLFNAILILYSYSLMNNVDQARRQLEAESRMDALTGLLNRRALHEHAEHLFSGVRRGNKKVAILFADLNKFKSINDQLGHTVGDRVLAEVGRLIRDSSRKSDLAARYGGDEFIVLLPDADLPKAQPLAQRLEERVAQWGRRNDIELGISIGIAEAPRHGHDLRSVLQSVDQAMYRGKADPSRGGIREVEDRASA